MKKNRKTLVGMAANPSRSTTTSLQCVEQNRALPLTQQDRVSPGAALTCVLALLFSAYSSPVITHKRGKRVPQLSSLAYIIQVNEDKGHATYVVRLQHGSLSNEGSCN
jgi:hypothetical protein